jgi:hypothetical protein
VIQKVKCDNKKRMEGVNQSNTFFYLHEEYCSKTNIHCCVYYCIFYFNPFEKHFSQIDTRGNLFHFWTHTRVPGLVAP